MKNFFIHFLTFFYSNIATFIEDIINKKKTISSNLNKYGFYKDRLKFKINFNNLIEKKLVKSVFLESLIIKENYINDLINNIFIINRVKDTLNSLTGFNYSIDFIVAYSTYNIDQANLEKDIYANHWHKDKPFSHNTLKIIIPIGEISNNQGPMEIMSINDSNKINFFSNLRDTNLSSKLKLIGTDEDIYFFLPNLCYHRAGNPLFSKKRSQIMLQLNPSNKWKYSTTLYEKQYLLEPKFPILNLNKKYNLI